MIEHDFRVGGRWEMSTGSLVEIVTVDDINYSEPEPLFVIAFRFVGGAKFGPAVYLRRVDNTTGWRRVG